MSFDGKTVLITGGGTGVGKGAAVAFLARGARVVLNGRREKVLAATARELDPSGGRVAIAPGDIGRRATAQALVDVAKERFGAPDVLVNAAGIFAPKPFLEHTEADVDAYIGTILKGTFYATQAA